MISLSGRFSADLRDGARVTVVAAWLQEEISIREHYVRHVEMVPTFLGYDSKTRKSRVFALRMIEQIDPTTRPRL